MRNLFQSLKREQQNLIAKNEFGVLGNKKGDILLLTTEDYALYLMNGNDANNYIVANIHFPSGMKADDQKQRISKLLADIEFQSMDLGCKEFVIGGDINCMTVTANEENVGEAQRNRGVILDTLAQYKGSAQSIKGHQFQVTFPTVAIQKDRIAGDITRNNQALYKNGITQEDTMIVIKGSFNTSTSQTRIRHNNVPDLTADLRVFDPISPESPETFPFDHYPMQVRFGQRRICFANTLETKGFKGLQEPKLKSEYDEAKSEQWTVDVADTLLKATHTVIGLSHELPKEFIHIAEALKNINIPREEQVEAIARLFIQRVSELHSTIAISDSLKKPIDWKKLEVQIIKKTLKKKGKDGFSLKYFSNVLGGAFSQQQLGGFRLSKAFYELLEKDGMEAAIEAVEVNQYHHIETQYLQRNYTTLISENIKHIDPFAFDANYLNMQYAKLSHQAAQINRDVRTKHTQETVEEKISPRESLNTHLLTNSTSHKPTPGFLLGEPKKNKHGFFTPTRGKTAGSGAAFFLGGGATMSILTAVGVSNIWNPVGWAILGVGCAALCGLLLLASNKCCPKSNESVYTQIAM